MSQARAIAQLKRAVAEHGDFEMIGFKREYLEMIIADLEKGTLQENEQKTSDAALMRMAHQIQACATPESQRALMREMQGRIERLEAWQKEQESDSVGMNYLLLATNLADLASQVNKLAKMAVSEKERPVNKSETDRER